MAKDVTIKLTEYEYNIVRKSLRDSKSRTLITLMDNHERMSGSQQEVIESELDLLEYLEESIFPKIDF